MSGGSDRGCLSQCISHRVCVILVWLVDLLCAQLRPIIYTWIVDEDSFSTSTIPHHLSRRLMHIIFQVLGALVSALCVYIIVKTLQRVYREWGSPLKALAGPPNPSVIFGNMKQIWNVVRDFWKHISYSKIIFLLGSVGTPWKVDPRIRTNFPLRRIRWGKLVLHVKPCSNQNVDEQILYDRPEGHQSYTHEHFCLSKTRTSAL